MPFVAAFRWVIQALRFGGGVQAPRNLRFTLGAESGGAYPVTVFWDKTPSWGSDSGGAGTRSYEGQYRQTENADGTPHTGANAAWGVQFVRGENDQLRHVNPSAPVGTVWETRIRVENRNGEHSDYAVLEIHAVEQDGFLILSRRYLRLGGRRLRLR